MQKLDSFKPNTWFLLQKLACTIKFTSVLVPDDPESACLLIRKPRTWSLLSWGSPEEPGPAGAVMSFQRGFYISVGTVDGSCVNYRSGSNCLQQTALALNQLFSRSLGGAHHCVGVFPTYHYAHDAHQLFLFCGVAFVPTPGGERFVLTHESAHHLENCLLVYLSIINHAL